MTMKRPIKITANIPFGSSSDELSKTTYGVTKYFDDESTEIESYSFVSASIIKEGNNLISKSLIYKIVLPSKDLLKQVTRIEFINCVFVNEVDLNFSFFDGDVIFKECVFTNNVTLFGSFYGYVSFEQSSFVNAKINFSECLFDSFNFRIVTLNSSDVSFQETEFRDESPLFSDMHLYGSSIHFMGTVFSTSSKIFNFLSVKADYDSLIQFRMVDFDFREFRLFKAKISTLDFSECTFNCNRFEWECECETLILQECRNFKILNLINLKGLKHLNICGLLNTGKILLGDDIDYYLNALKTNKDIFWVRADERRQITLQEFKNQLFTMLEFFAANQSKQTEAVRHEIKVIEREELMMSEQGLKTRIFLSYSWKDELLADSIDAMFADSGITLIRDKRDIEYRSSIKEFMKQIRFNDYVILVISPDYLKSASCMYEIAELTKDENYKTRILPIMKPDTNIFDSIDRSSYILYWQGKYKELYASSNMLEPLNRSEVISELLRYERIMRDLPVFLQNISDMNMIKCGDSIDADGFAKMLSIIKNVGIQSF